MKILHSKQLPMHEKGLFSWNKQILFSVLQAAGKFSWGRWRVVGAFIEWTFLHFKQYLSSFVGVSGFLAAF